MNARLQTISLDTLIKAVPAYVQTARLVLAHPIMYARNLQLDDEQEFARAIAFVNYSIVVTFIIVIPVMLNHGDHPSKLAYLLRFILQYAMYGVILHCVLWLLGARRYGLKGTLTSYAFLVGTFAPVYLILLYPLLMKTGIVGIFGSFNQSLGIGKLLADNIGLLMYLNVLNLGVGVGAIVLVTRWFAATHQIRKLHVFVAIMASGLVGGAIQLFVIAPVFEAISPVLGLF